MMHISREELSAYICNQQPEASRTLIEEHLYGCQECLELYMEGLEGAHTELPVLTEPDVWTDRLMNRIVPQKRWYHHPLFHYGIAAAIMLVVTVSGLIQQWTWEPTERKESSGARTGPSYSEQLMLQTITVIDQIKDKRGGTHE